MVIYDLLTTFDDEVSLIWGPLVERLRRPKLTESFLPLPLQPQYPLIAQVCFLLMRYGALLMSTLDGIRAYLSYESLLFTEYLFQLSVHLAEGLPGRGSKCHPYRLFLSPHL